MTELYEREDLDELIVAFDRHNVRTIAAWNAGEIDGPTFARESSANRLLGLALVEALAIRRCGEVTPTYRARVRHAAAAIGSARVWQEIDSDLAELLGGG